MPDSQPVIVATDGSNRSLRMLPHAARIATYLGAPLEVVRVLEASDVSREPGEDAALARQRVAQTIEAELAGSLQASGLGAEIRVVAPQAGRDAAGTILEMASRAAILAMQSRGRGSLGRLLHGSVARGVLEMADLPVMLGGPELLAPPGEGDAYRLLVTVDLSPGSGVFLGRLVPLLAWSAFDVSLLYVRYLSPAGQDNDGDRARDEAALSELRDRLPSALAVKTLIKEIPFGAGVDTSIMEAAAQIGADAIAMSTHGHSARYHLLMGSVAMSVLGRSGVPLIALRAQEEPGRA